MKNERLIKFIILGILTAAILWFGLRPLLKGTSFKEYLKDGRAGISFDENEYATIVVGSDPEGVAAALAVARTGLKTLLITEDNDLGGYLKQSLIVTMDPQNGNIENKKIPLNQGIYEEIFGNFTTGYSSEDYEKAVEDLTDAENSLHIIYESFVTAVDVEGKLLKGITVKQPNGSKHYRAYNFIDASRDGDLLYLCETPYFNGSADVGVPDYYAPLQFNFKVSGVDTEALKKSKGTINFLDEFQLALLAYKKANSETKIISPSFIILNESELVITGVQVFNVNIEDEQEMLEAYKSAEEEAIMLTAFLKTVMIPFKDCIYGGGPEKFFVPEYRHYEGRYRLTVSDILENRDFEDKIALCSVSVDAGKFTEKSKEYIVAKPKIYSIPLGAIISSNMNNVLMIGSKASFTSLASTSAGSLPTRITVGESAGLVSAFSFMNKISLSDLLNGSENELKAMKNYLSRGGVKLSDFSESITIPGSDQMLSEHWAYSHVKTLAEYGLIYGGKDNDFKLDYKAGQELLSVLIKNAVIKMAPDHYNLDLDGRLKPFEIQDELTGETAAEIVLEALSIRYEKGAALEKLKQEALLSDGLAERLVSDKPVTMDVVYGLTVETLSFLQ